MDEKEDPGKVQLKAILKGNAAQAIRPAAMSGFKVADFQMNTTGKESIEEHLKNEVSAMQSHVASLNGEIANLKKKIEQEAKIGYDKGVQEGKVLGAVEGEKKAIEKWNANLKALQDNAAKTFESIAAQQKEHFEKIEGVTAEIALAIAKRIFCEEVAENQNIISRVLKEAFTFLGQEENLKVRINPVDVTTAEKTESFWKPMSSSIKNVEIVCDKAIERGGCLLESENGSSIDMRVQTILKHLEDGIKRIY